MADSRLIVNVTCIVGQASQYLAIGFACLFPVFSVLVEPSASIFLGFIVLVSSIVFIAGDKRAPLPVEHKWIACIFCLNVVFALVMFFVKGYNYQGWRELGRMGRLLLLWPVLLFFLYARPPVKYFWVGICIASLGAGMTAIYELMWLGVSRANATMNAILFGDISLIYSAFSGIASAYFYSTNRRAWATFAILASILGMFAVVASGTRGAWLAIPVISVILLYSAWGVLNFTLRLIVIVSPILLVIALLCTPQLNVQSRISSIGEELNQFQSGLVQGSLGQRLEMWRVSTDAWLDSPVSGLGQGRYSDFVAEGIAEGIYSKSISIHSHSHSDYFFILASRGGVGILLLMAMYFLLLRYAFLWRGSATPREVRFSALALAVVTVGYALFGVTEAIFVRSQAVSIWVLLVGFLLASVHTSAHKLKG